MRNDIPGFILSALAGLFIAFWLVSDVHEVDRAIIRWQVEYGFRAP
jgi:hypothetical protein